MRYLRRRMSSWSNLCRRWKIRHRRYCLCRMWNMRRCMSYRSYRTAVIQKEKAQPVLRQPVPFFFLMAATDHKRDARSASSLCLMPASVLNFCFAFLPAALPAFPSASLPALPRASRFFFPSGKYGSSRRASGSVLPPVRPVRA